MTKEKHPDYQFLDEAERREVERVAGGEGQRVGRGMFGGEAFRAVWSGDRNAKKRAKKLVSKKVSKR